MPSMKPDEDDALTSKQNREALQQALKRAMEREIVEDTVRIAKSQKKTLDRVVPNYKVKSFKERKYPYITPDKVMVIAEDVFGYSADQFRSDSRRAALSSRRMIVLLMLRDLGLTQQAAAHFLNKDHTLGSYALKAVPEKLATDQKLRRQAIEFQERVREENERLCLVQPPKV